MMNGAGANNMQIEEALRKAFAMGEKYWMLADHENPSYHRKAQAVKDLFHVLVSDTLSDLNEATIVPEPKTGTNEQDVALRDAIAASLNHVYSCTRVWSAWSYGTMTQDDFVLASEDDDIIANIFDAVKNVIMDCEKDPHDA